MAALLLKTFISFHWSIVGPDERQLLTFVLPNAIADASSKIRTAVSLVLAHMVKLGYEELQSSLLSQLLALLHGVDPVYVSAAVRCLTVLCEVCDSQLTQIVPVVMPKLAELVVAPQTTISIRAKVVHVMRRCVKGISAIDGHSDEHFTSIIGPHLQAFLDLASMSLSAGTDSLDSHSISLQLEVLKLLTVLVSEYGKHSKAAIVKLLLPLWKLLTELAKSYDLVVNDSSFEEGYDSEGELVGIDGLVTQLLELFSAIISSSSLRSTLSKHMGPLIKVVTSFMRAPQRQVEEWETDGNGFIADDDDEFSFTVRVSVVPLIETIIADSPVKATSAILEALNHSIQQAGSASSPSIAWKYQEVSLWLVCLLTDGFRDEPKEMLKALPKDIRSSFVSQFVEGIVLPQLRIDNPFPFLYARALLTVGCLVPYLSETYASRLIQLLVEPLLCSNLNVAPRLAASRAIGRVVTDDNQIKLNQSWIRPYLQHAVSGVCSLLSTASEETLHLVTETLTPLLKIDGHITMAIEPELSALVLSLWSKHQSDILLEDDLLEVIQIFAALPECQQSLLDKTLPTIHTVLSHPHQQAAKFIASCIDLLVSLLAKVPSLTPSIYDAVVPPLLSLLATTDDNAILQNGSRCLHLLVKNYAKDLINCGVAPHLIHTVGRMLQPDMGDSDIAFLGGLVTQMMISMPEQIAPISADLLKAVALRIPSLKYPTPVQSLVTIVARMILSQGGEVVGFLGGLEVDGSTALVAVLQKWLRYQHLFKGYSQTVSVCALVRLLELRDERIRSCLLPMQEHSKNLSPQLAPRIFGVLLKALRAETDKEAKRAQRLLKHAAAENDDEEWEDESDDEPAHDPTSTSTTSKSPFAEYSEDASKYVDFDFEDSDGDDDEDESRWSADDPVFHINLKNHLIKFFADFASSCRDEFMLIVQALPVDQKQLVQQFFLGIK
eukprot:GILK01006801.1.p1 GENE.GILK01006801.1~~GILK01006801.1.p1  ORF type:complete len:1021 (-),score=206.79 GILK01006801.1:23-2866(-)